MTRLALPTSHRKRAFSLAEVLIALLVFVLGMYGVLSLLGSSRRISEISLRRLQATALAEGQLNVLEAAGYDAVRAELEETTPSLPLSNAIPFEENAPFEWQVETDDGAASEALLLRVTVSWSQDNKRGVSAPIDKRVSLTTLLSGEARP